MHRHRGTSYNLPHTSIHSRALFNSINTPSHQELTFAQTPASAASLLLPTYCVTVKNRKMPIYQVNRGFATRIQRCRFQSSTSTKQSHKVSPVEKEINRHGRKITDKPREKREKKYGTWYSRKLELFAVFPKDRNVFYSLASIRNSEAEAEEGAIN